MVANWRLAERRLKSRAVPVWGLFFICITSSEMSVSCSTVLIQTDLHRLRSTKHPFPGIRKVDGHPSLARQGNGEVPRVGLLGDNLA